MAKTCKLLVVLWLVAAFVGPSATSELFYLGESEGSGGSGDSGETTTSETAEPTAPPTSSSDPCEPNPCGDGSTCEPLAGKVYECLCLPGDSYDNTTKTCNKAKVFPGELQLQTDYTENLADKTTNEFQQTSNNITTALNKGLEKLDKYTGSRVVKFERAPSKTKSENQKAVASVEMIFELSSTETDETLKNKIDTTIVCTECPLSGSTYSSSDLCKSKACDEDTTICEPQPGSYSCHCKDSYINSDFSERICIACPSGMEAKDNGCVDCPFGYSGLNCGENWKLVLVIVGSVLGGLLLITLIILPVVALKSPKKKSKKSKNEDIGKPYVSHSPAKAPLVNGSFVGQPASSFNGSANGPSGNSGVPRIPRATSNNNWDNRNNLEMTPSNSRQNLVPGRNMRSNDDADDNFPYSRPQSNPYAQPRPQGNPYAQNRAQVNPYAERQGHSNPYYTHDEGRRY